MSLSAQTNSVIPSHKVFLEQLKSHNLKEIISAHVGFVHSGSLFIPITGRVHRVSESRPRLTIKGRPVLFHLVHTSALPPGSCLKLFVIPVPSG